MMNNGFHNKLISNIEQLSETLKQLPLQATTLINQLPDEKGKAFFETKLKEAMTGKIDIKEFLKQIENAKKATNNE